MDRLTKALICRKRDKICEPLSPGDIDVAYKIIFAASMDQTLTAIDQGDLASLRVFKSAGIVYTQGQVRHGLEQLLGVARLPVILPGTRLAKLIMIASHAEDHRRTHTDALARSREQAWIVRGAKLAKSVVGSCPKC